MMHTTALKTSPPSEAYKKQGSNAQKNENISQPDIFSLLPIFLSFNKNPDPRRASPRNNGMKTRGCSAGGEEQGYIKYPTINMTVGTSKKINNTMLSLYTVSVRLILDSLPQ